MKNKFSFFHLAIFSIILTANFSQAQTQLSPQFISLGGGETNTSKYNISYSIGEPVIGLTENLELMLRQGFQYLTLGFGSNLNCFDNLTVNETVENDFYQANSMQSNATIPEGTNVTFQSQESITLIPGFEVESNSSFTATIKDCE